MRAVLIRLNENRKQTLGRFFLFDGLDVAFECCTLELPFKANVKNISCIPTGEYRVRLRLPRESATRDYVHLLVKDVPNRDFILFHRGNSSKDTRGCILVGQGSQQDVVHNSTLAMDLLMKEIINLGGTNINLIIKNR